MEKYIGYDLQDFLADADFRAWILAGQPTDHPIWPTLLLHLPDKEPLMTAAEALFLTWAEGSAACTEKELDLEIDRILDSTLHEPTRPFWRFIPASVAAALVCVMGACCWIFLQKPGNKMQVTALLTAERLIDLENDSDTIQAIVLPDSTQIKLFPNARLRFSAHLGTEHAPDPDKREVNMSGKIYFDVKRNERLPFVIYSNEVITRVLGTSFTISAVKDQYSLEVKSGRVAVEKLNIFQSEEVFVQPNQKVVFTARSFSSKQKELEKSLTENPTPVQTAVQTETSFEYRNSSLETVFRDLENTYGIPIIYDPQGYKHCTISVRLHDESFYSKLNIICQTLKTTYEVIDGEIIMQPGTCE